ncbi:MAG: chromate transporter [Anaerolineaceae bacterium]|nr:chromate transporter [Anaerolineaceae bacterium]
MMTDRPRPSLWELFSTFVLLGIQSFGGGSSTFLLIHQTSVNRGWLSEEEFVRDYALSQIAPGINLLKLTILIGSRLRGRSGIIVSLLGLLVPSAAVTALMTAGFASIRSQPVVQAAMKGILPATIGLSLAMGVQMAAPLLSGAYKEGPVRLSANIVIVLLAAVLMAFTNISPVLVLLMAGAATVPLLAILPAQSKQPVKEDPG